ncbi:MAG: amidohydrolase, partial [Planctomycetota bacterium]
ELSALGIEHKAGYAKGTGVVAHLPATNGSDADTVALRTDIDALPIAERTGKPYASTNDGTMHACGHDGHTAILLGAARVLSKVERPRPVTLIFQPAEENGGGGELMVDEGALAGASAGGVGRPVTRIFGLHGWPEMPLGTVASRPGPLLAATDDFEVTIKGVQAHAAWPHAGRDPIVAASAIITALQTITSRGTAPTDAVVCTVGAIHGGTADNIIPESVEFIGTIRTLSDENRANAERRLREIVEHTARAHGCEAEITWKPGYPVTRNDEALAERWFGLAREALGEGRVFTVPNAFMGGEDFSYYGRAVPACFFLLGLRPGGHDGPVPQLHQPEFDFNDDSLGLGVEMMVRLATS